MCSVVTHALVGVLGGRIHGARSVPRRFWFFAVLCATLPDADVIGFHLGVPYESFFRQWGGEVILSEARWVWTPLLLTWLCAHSWRHLRAVHAEGERRNP